MECTRFWNCFAYLEAFRPNCSYTSNIDHDNVLAWSRSISSGCLRICRTSSSPRHPSHTPFSSSAGPPNQYSIILSNYRFRAVVLYTEWLDNFETECSFEQRECSRNDVENHRECGQRYRGRKIEKLRFHYFWNRFCCAVCKSLSVSNRYKCIFACVHEHRCFLIICIFQTC